MGGNRITARKTCPSDILFTCVNFDGRGMEHACDGRKCLQSSSRACSFFE